MLKTVLLRVAKSEGLRNRGTRPNRTKMVTEDIQGNQGGRLTGRMCHLSTGGHRHCLRILSRLNSSNVFFFQRKSRESV